MPFLLARTTISTVHVSSTCLAASADAITGGSSKARHRAAAVTGRITARPMHPGSTCFHMDHLHLSGRRQLNLTHGRRNANDTPVPFDSQGVRDGAAPYYAVNHPAACVL